MKDSELHLTGPAYLAPTLEKFAAFFFKKYSRKPVGAELLVYYDKHRDEWSRRHPGQSFGTLRKEEIKVKLRGAADGQ